MNRPVTLITYSLIIVLFTSKENFRNSSSTEFDCSLQ